MIRKKEGFQGQKAIVIPRNILNSKCAREAVTTPLYITDIGYYPKARFHFRKRIHGADQHILIYCHEGKGSISIKKETYAVAAGDCLLIPRKWPHEYAADDNDPWTIYWAHFTGHTADALVSMAQQQHNGPRIFLPHASDRIDLFNHIYAQLEKGYRNENLYYANMSFWYFLASCIFPGIYHPEKSDLRHNAIDQAIQYMKAHLHQMLTLQQMATAVNLSPSHFSYLFKTDTGFPPIEYFNHLKMQKACQYLLFTNLRIKEVAAQLGIEDPYYFSRLFNKVMGLSPNQYREKGSQS
ncbi:AraC family transcriptional regulator [Chitinophaga vietnamensis]|uniref:AraC family transcriptional regulator n=1 Tax=Chitinophaga vietnamensis TaxID=2593957 RepID=UPI00191C6DD9|nr:AraC family transcriptional regulator [Chitinophaga vietnamensis]